MAESYFRPRVMNQEVASSLKLLEDVRVVFGRGLAALEEWG